MTAERIAAQYFVNGALRRAALIVIALERIRELNLYEDSIIWSLRVLDDKINKRFETIGGLDALGFDELNQVIGGLTDRLNNLKSK